MKTKKYKKIFIVNIIPSLGRADTQAKNIIAIKQLIGFASSVSTILKFNERTEE
jgi:hypothetical protein